MKHELKIVNNDATNIPEELGVDAGKLMEIEKNLLREMISLSLESEQQDGTITEDMIRNIDNYKSDWEPKKANDYFLLGFAFCGALKDFKKVKRVLEEEGRRSPLSEMLGL